MRDGKLNIMVIIGSNREQRLASRVGDWVSALARSCERFAIDIADVADLDLPHNYPAEPTAAVLNLRRRIDTADGFIVVTPEYNHSFPAPLKHAIDQAYEEWRAKPVGFVSYGGVSGGLRAVEALRLVFAELQSVTLRGGVSFPFAWSTFEDDAPANTHASQTRAARTMLSELAWWATTLRHARQQLPFDSFAAEPA